MPRRYREIENPWIHGGLAAVVASLLLLLSFHLPFMRYVVDGVSLALRIPEYPALYLRARGITLFRWFESGEEMRRRMDTLERENLLLRTMLARKALLEDEAPPASTPTLLSARVLLRHPQNWWEEIKIDVGASRGVRPGAPVLFQGHLVGRVRQVQPFDAWVRLITSRSFSIPAVVEDTRDLGVLTGSGEGQILLRYVPEERSLPLGSSVITSLLDEDFPPGIPIGILGEEGSTSFGGFRSYRVRSGVPLSKLYVVQVMKQKASD
jgi:rod shape-determining protein MreC